jgi:nucleoside-diphosphate-sugar epimerase
VTAGAAGPVVVTGSTGMLGTHLVRRLLDDGNTVRGLDLNAPSTMEPGLSHTIGDIRDRAVLAEVCAGAAAVVHCASALPSYPAETIRSVIVDGTRAVLSAARAARVSRVVQISSTAVYGLPSVTPTPEDYPRRPVDPYSRAKTEAEELAERFRAEGLSLCVLRPKTFLGPGRMGLFAMLFEWAEQGHHFPVLGRGDVRIQMLAVEDLVDAVTVALAAPDAVADDTYNIAAAEFGTLRADFQAVLDAAGHGKRVIGVPARPALLLLDGLERLRLSPVYGRLRHKLLNDSFVSVERAATRLGFRPRYSNRDAILATYRWWQSTQWNNRAAPAKPAGRTSRDPWRQGALAVAKAFF